MNHDHAGLWKSAFLKALRDPEYSSGLKQASLDGRLGDWTKALTAAVVKTCSDVGWKASAKGHPVELLPVSRGEYLALDVMAFPKGENSWRFPTAVFELENSRDDDYIAYAFWKVLCVRSDLRIVFCYRRTTDEGSRLIGHLRDEVVRAMELNERVNLAGQTMIVVGTRGEAETFPYGFFKWWALDTNTGAFSLL